MKSEGFSEKVFELRLGVNTFGRSPDSDFPVNHPTVSGFHCEIELTLDGIFVRDTNSTNGTYLNGTQIKEGRLEAEQTLRLGEVEFFVDNIDVKIEIPPMEVPVIVQEPLIADGEMLCQAHPEARVTHYCSFCRKYLCSACVTVMKRKGGKALKLCPKCSHALETLEPAKQKKKSLIQYLRTTVKMPFMRRTKQE